MATAGTKSRQSKTPVACTGMLTIGALARASGVPVLTLRTWERRYGYPHPDRTRSGHRAYAPTSVPRLRRIADALTQGHRAGQVVAASDAELTELLRCRAEPIKDRSASAVPMATSIEGLIDVVRTFDARLLVSRLRLEWHRLGPVRFVRDVVAPFLVATGDAWADGVIGIQHEHFVSEKVGDLLRELRTPLDEHAQGPLVVFATLPGERHALGLQMSALVMAASDWRVCLLGVEVPVALLTQMVRDIDARAVGLSLSSRSSPRESRDAIQKLRRLLPKRVAVLLGGAGATSGVEGTLVVHHPDELATWASRHAHR